MPGKVQSDVHISTSAASAYFDTALVTVLKRSLHRFGQGLCRASNRQELGLVLTYTAAGSLTAMICQQPPTVVDIDESFPGRYPEQ